MRIGQDVLVTEEVLTLSDVARELGVSRQALYKRRGTDRPMMPEPDYRTPGGSPLWRRSTLIRAGVLESTRFDQENHPEEKGKAPDPTPSSPQEKGSSGGQGSASEEHGPVENV